MKPYASNSQKDTCSPISSNCVIWQGPDLVCINLCKGDSISDITYKLAMEVCELKSAAGISDLDLTCLVKVCSTTPEPQKTLANILELLITKICCLSDIVNNLPSNPANPNAPTTPPYVEPTLNLPVCLQYSDGVGGTVTQLIHHEYTLRIATILCSFIEYTNLTLAANATELSDHEIRITALEDAPQSVMSSCLLGGVYNVDLVLQELESQFCSYTTVLGSTSNLTAGIGSQCVSGSNAALSIIGTMSDFSGWNISTSNVGQMLQNMWITICDMRTAIYDLKSCCKTDCSAFFLGFTSGVNAERTTVTLIFNSGTIIPAGFSNCPSLSTVTISDGIGHIFTTTFDLVTEATDPAGIAFDVSVAFLDPTMNYSITVDGCIIKDGISCSKTISGVELVPVTTTTTSTTSTTTVLV